MTKKLSVIILSILMLFSMSLALTACGKDEPQQPVHEHTFATEWTTDETHHWHKCTGDGCNEVKDKAEHSYTNGFCVCGKTEPTPSVVYTVTEEEWSNAFGLDKPFYFADNYKLSMLGTMDNVTIGDESFTVDGNKVKDESLEPGMTEKHIEYYSFEQDKYYIYRNYSSWQKNDVQENPMHYVFDEMLTPFLDMSLFTYDEQTHTYKCATMSLEGAGGTSVVLNNLSVNFENKKAVKFTYDFSFHIEVVLVYGGQSVTLPEIHEHTFATEWSSNETHHWHAATCEHTSEKKNYAEHTYTNGVCVCGKEKPTPQVQKMTQTEWENTFDFSNVTITVYQAETKESLNLLTEDSAIKYLIAGDNMSMESTVLSMNIPSSLKSEIIKSYDFSNEYDNVVFNNGKYTLDEYTFTSMEESVTYQDVEFVFANGKIQSFTAKVITEVDYGSGPETETTYTKVEFDNYGTTIVEEKAELPITQQQFVEIFSASNFENVTIDYHDYIEFGTLSGETKTPSGDPIEITVNIKYADQKSSFDYYNDGGVYLSYFYSDGDVYEKNSLTGEYELFKVRYQNDAFYVLNLETGEYDDLLTKQEVLNMLELLPETLLSSIVNFSENDGIMYQLLTYDEETSLYTIDLAGIAMFTFRIEDDKLSYLSMYSYMEFENEYSIFDVVYTFSNYGETEISLPHIHNFSLEQVEAKYLASSADCIHYATYYKSCECGEKGTETFIYEDGGYGEHIHTESKGKVDPTCHTFGYEAGEYCTDCQQYISGHDQIAMTSHSWIIDTENSKEANCTEAGIIAYKCSCEGCEETKTEVGDPAKNHSVSIWTEKSKVKVIGTTKCEYTITYEGICSNCEETITKVEVEERHEFYWAVTTEPTCQGDGEKTEYCLDENCKYHTTAHATDVYKLPEGADGHNWVVDAENSNKFICSHCSAEKTIVSSSGNTLSGSNLTTVDEIQLSTASVSMNDAMKSSLADAELSITAEEKSKEDVLASVSDASDKEKIAKAKAVFDFTLTKNGEAQSDLGGEITIRIPYILQPGDDPDKILVVCILENGKLEEFIATYANGFITFKTNHFSIYSVVELTPAEYCAKYDCHKQKYITANPDKFNVIAPTCTLGGYTVCLHCGAIFNETAPLGHSWVTKTESTASCTQNGCEHHECSVCGIGYNTYTPAIGHNYLIDSEEKATCTATGSITYKCSHCNDVYTVTTAKLNHNYIVETFEVTCTENGYTKKVCHTCGAEIYTNIVDPLGHSFGNVWVKTNDGHYHVCERCGEIDEIHTHIPGAVATETTAQICTECGYIVVPALGHTCKSHLTKVDAVNADCLNNGNVEYYVCDCGKWYLDENAQQLITDHLSVIINALGHDIENRVAVEPTCTEVGYTAGVWCSRCQKYVSGHIEIPRKVHSYTAVVTKPTCENDGYTTYTCSCGHIEFGNKTKKLGHNYVDEIIAPTCTEKGYTKHTCINCGDTSNINEVSALGHAWKIEYETDKDYHWHICSRCNELSEKEAHISDYTEATEEHGITCTECGYVIAERLNHVHAGTKHDAVSATCTTSGNYEYYVCSCGEWFYDADCTRNVTNKSLIIISPFGHIKTLYTRVEPTCTEYGYTEGYYCEVCKQWLSGHEKLEKDGNNHVHVVYHEAVERTCTEDGHDEYWECLDCHGVYSDKDCTVYGYVVDKAWGHLYETTVVEPKCEEGGYDLHVCSVCGDEYRDNETMPIDHAYNIAERKDATCQEEGYIVWVCIHDLSHSYRQTLPIVSHDYQVTETVEQTCTTGGYKVYTCRFCGDSYHGEEVGPRGHIPCEWYSDETYHWHICVECNEICDKEEHTPNFEEATTEHGIRCMFCDYVIEPILEIQYTWSADAFNDVSGEVINAIEFYTNKSLIWTETMKYYGHETVRLKGTWSQPAESIISAVIDELGVFSFKINDDGTLTKQEDPTEEVKYTFDATITIEDMTITQHIDLYSNGVAKVWAVAGLERQELEGVWVEKDGEVTITINNDPQVFYVNEDGKTLTQGNKPIEPSGELVYTYDDDMGGMILHYEFYDDNTMFATAKSNGQIYATINGTWEIKDGKVVAYVDGGEEIYTINGDGTLSPYEEPTESDEQEFIKAFDSSNFANFTIEIPMGKQMFDYPNGLVFIENYSEYRPYILMLYNGNWYMKENGNWAMADEKDYISFVYENTVNMMTEMAKMPHRFDNGTWYVNVGGRELPFYIENGKLAYQTMMSEKDAHFYDYGTTVIEVPQSLLEYIEGGSEQPEKEVVYTFADSYEDGGNTIVETIELFSDNTAVLTDTLKSSGKLVGEMTGTWKENKDGTITVYIDELGELLFKVSPDGTLISIQPGEKEVQYTANFYWRGLEFALTCYTDYTFDVEVMRDGKPVANESAKWEYSDDKVCAYFNGDPLFFEIKGDELIFIDPEGDKEFVRYDYSLYPDGGELTFYLGSTLDDVIEVIKNTQFHYVKYGITKNDEWWTVEEKLVTLSENNIGDISRINFNTIDSVEFSIIYEGISFNIYARVIPDLRNATIVETFIYETIKYYVNDEPVWGERYITLYDNGYASYHYENEDNYSYCAYEKATNGNDELVKIVSYGQGVYLKKTPETKDGYHFYVDYKHGEKEYTEYRLYIVGSGLEIKLYVFDDRFCEYYSNEPDDIENFRYEGTIDIVLSEDKTEITFMGSTYTIDENNMLIITLPDEQPEINIAYMNVADFKLYNNGKMFYVMEDVVVAQGDWYKIDDATVRISMMGMDQTFYKWKVDGNWYGEEEPDFESAEVIKCKKQGEDTQYTLYLFSDWWDAYLNDGTSFIDCNYEADINIITIYGLFTEYYYLCNGILSPAMHYDVRSTSGVYGSAYLVESLSVAVINLGSLTDYDMAELSYSLNGNEITFTIGGISVTGIIEGGQIFVDYEKEVQYTANFYWNRLNFSVKFYTDYTFDAEVQRDGKEIFSGGADWEYVDGKVLAYFNGDPLFFEINGDELIFVDPEGDKEFVRYDYSLYPDGGELTFYLGSTRNDVVEVIKNTQFHYVKYGITKNDEWWTLEEKSVTLSENNIGDISRINFNTIDSVEFSIIYEGISFNIYARVIPDLRNATIVETFIYETIKYYVNGEPVWGERYITLYDNGYASYHYKNEDNYSYCAYEKATNGNDELVKIVSYGQGMYLKKTPETKDGYHFYVDYKHGENEYTEYRLYIVGSGLEIKLYVFDDKFCEYYSNEPDDIENFRYEGTIDIVLSDDKTEITFMGSTYSIDENNMLIITLPDKVPEFDIIYMGVVNFKLYDDGSMFYVMDGVVVMQGLWSTIDEKTICISLAEGNITFYKWEIDGNWYGEEEPDFESAEVIKCKKQGEDTQYTLYLFSGWDAYLNDGTSFIDCNYEADINIITIYGLYSEYYYLCNGILSPAMYYDVRSTSGVHGSAYLVESLSVAVINLGSLTDYDMAELSYSLNGNEITFTIGETTVSCVMEGKTIIYNDGTPSDGREEYEILEYVFYVSKEGEKSEIILEVINQFIDKNCEFLQEFIENYDKIKDDIKMPDLSDNKSGILTVLTNADYEPFEYYENGEIVGVDVFIMTNIAEALDMKIEWIDLDFDMLLSKLQSSENAVVASAISYNEYRLQYGYASKPYYTEKHIVE